MRTFYEAVSEREALSLFAVNETENERVRSQQLHAQPIFLIDDYSGSRRGSSDTASVLSLDFFRSSVTRHSGASLHAVITWRIEGVSPFHIVVRHHQFDSEEFFFSSTELEKKGVLNESVYAKRNSRIRRQLIAISFHRLDENFVRLPFACLSRCNDTQYKGGRKTITKLTRVFDKDRR